MPFWKTEFSVMHINKYVSNFQLLNLRNKPKKIEKLAQRKAVKYMRELQVLCWGREPGDVKDSRDRQAQRGCSCGTAGPN